MHLINERNATVVEAELILCIHQNKSLLSGYFLSPRKYHKSLLPDSFPYLWFHDLPRKDFLFGNILIVTFLSFGSRRKDRFFKTLVFNHSMGQGYAAKAAFAGL